MQVSINLELISIRSDGISGFERLSDTTWPALGWGLGAGGGGVKLSPEAQRGEPEKIERGCF